MSKIQLETFFTSSCISEGEAFYRALDKLNEWNDSNIKIIGIQWEKKLTKFSGEYHYCVTVEVLYTNN